MPILGLGAVLALAPGARAQADASPDHFDDGVSNTVPANAVPAKTKPATPSSVQSHNQKGNSHTAAQTTSSKKPAEAQKAELVAASDKRKTPPRKPNNQ
jgi:hypothetical protein